MTEKELARRIVATEAGVSSSDMRRGNITQEQFLKIEAAARTVGEWPLYFDACAGLTPQQLRSRARKAVRKHGVGLIVLDYVQLMHAPGTTREYDRLTEASNCLKPLANDLKVPVIALAQLSRACEQREDKRPMLSDLRGTGSLEQDADMVAFMFREEYYLEREEPDPADKGYSLWQERMRNCRGKAEFILAKGRHGPTGTAVLDFNAPLSIFYDEVLP
jgi:replicative DNA helicase